MHKHHGFTLVELLVVIAIISILASMLLPALDSALGQARRAACLNNMKQMYSVFAIYYEDFGGWLPTQPIQQNGFNDYGVSPSMQGTGDQGNWKVANSPENPTGEGGCLRRLFASPRIAPPGLVLPGPFFPAARARCRGQPPSPRREECDPESPLRPPAPLSPGSPSRWRHPPPSSGLVQTPQPIPSTGRGGTSPPSPLPPCGSNVSLAGKPGKACSPEVIPGRPRS